MKPIQVIEHNGYTIKIMPDEDAADPRENDNVSKMFFWHTRYDLGDSEERNASRASDRFEELAGWDAVGELIEEEYGPLAAIVPVSMIDHSGLHLYVGSGAHPSDPGGWDSGMIGFAFVTQATVEYERHVDASLRDEDIEWARKMIEAELDEYNLYLGGGYVGYVIENPNGEIVDSLWGFDDVDYAIESAKAEVPELPPNPKLQDKGAAAGACIALIRAYDNGKRDNGEMEWDDVGIAYELAKQALGIKEGKS
jgi:hypothetical protein